jgi:hypothetical protein
VRRRRGNSRGSVLIEGALGFGAVLLPLFALECEVIRASQYHALFHHWTFHYVRSRALGVGEARARSQIRAKARAAFGSEEARRVSRSLTSETWREGRGIKGRLKYRYPGFFATFHPRFQVTKGCLFSS